MIRTARSTLILVQDLEGTSKILVHEAVVIKFTAAFVVLMPLNCMVLKVVDIYCIFSCIFSSNM